jgi:hypothetical protein
VRIVLTDQSGHYQAPALPVGDYQITCEAAGFKRVVVPRVTPTIDQRERVDLRLEVGGLLPTIGFRILRRCGFD